MANAVEYLSPKETVVDRLRWRVQHYRKEQKFKGKHYKKLQIGVFEQNYRGTEALRQRFFDAKEKKSLKKMSSDNKKQEYFSVQPLLKRPLDSVNTSLDAIYKNNFSESECLSKRINNNNIPNADASKVKKPAGLTTKLSVEIVQQLDNLQQIQTNVTVKASSGSVSPGTVSNKKGDNSTEFKQLSEGDSSGFSDNLSNLVIEDDLINSDTFKDIMSTIDLPADLDFDIESAFCMDNTIPGVSVKHETSTVPKVNIPHTLSNVPNIHLYQSQSADFGFPNIPTPVMTSSALECKSNPISSYNDLLNSQKPAFGSYDSVIYCNGSLTDKQTHCMGIEHRRSFPDMATGLDCSPAAQTLKQMAEQHQQQQYIPDTNASSMTLNDGNYLSNFGYAIGTEDFNVSMSRSSKQNSGVYTHFCNSGEEILPSLDSRKKIVPDLLSASSKMTNYSPHGNLPISNCFSESSHNISCSKDPSLHHCANMANNGMQLSTPNNDSQMQIQQNVSMQANQSTSLCASSPMMMQLNMSQSIRFQSTADHNSPLLHEIISTPFSKSISDCKKIQVPLQQQCRKFHEQQNQNLQFQNSQFPEVPMNSKNFLNQNQIKLMPEHYQSHTRNPPCVYHKVKSSQMQPQNLQNLHQSNWKQVSPYRPVSESCLRNSCKAFQPNNINFHHNSVQMQILQQQSMEMKFQQPMQFPIITPSKVNNAYNQVNIPPINVYNSTGVKDFQVNYLDGIENSTNMVTYCHDTPGNIIDGM